MDLTDTASAWIALAHIAEPGDAGVGRLVAERGPIDAVACIGAQETGLRNGPGLALRLAGFELAAAWEQADRVDARILTRGGPGWPTQLDDLGDATPFALWVAGAGELRLLALRSVSVVGARACTAYGEEVARGWCADLAESGWTVVSGAAAGIDAAAHRGALAGGGATIAVVAGGVDVHYPRENAGLFARILDDGLIVSESPPGEGVRRQRFLTRNRVIAALSRATLVVEAARRSGAASTAAAAAGLNRPVLAVPGPVSSPASAGCHRLMRDGIALCVADVDDVRGTLGLDGGGEPARVDRAERDVSAWDRLADRERRVLDALPRRGGATIADVVRGTTIGSVDVMAALAVLEAAGLARCAGERWRSVPAAGAPAH